METKELKEHIQEEIAELNKREGKDKQRYELHKTEECLNVIIRPAETLVDIETSRWSKKVLIHPGGELRKAGDLNISKEDLELDIT